MADMHSEASQCLNTAESSSTILSASSTDLESRVLMFSIEEGQAQSKHPLLTWQCTIHGVECRDY